jgi:hypothetical protein
MVSTDQVGAEADLLGTGGSISQASLLQRCQLASYEAAASSDLARSRDVVQWPEVQESSRRGRLAQPAVFVT